MTTTIQISNEIKETLSHLKLHQRETYNDVLERLISDVQELNDQTKRDLQKAIKEIESGNYRSHSDVAQELGFN